MSQAFRKALNATKISFEAARKTGLAGEEGSFTKFEEQRADANRRAYFSAVERLQQATTTLPDTEVQALVGQLGGMKDADKIASTLMELGQVQMSEPTITESPDFTVPGISEQVEADKAEIDICFNHGAYRSAVILCGRVLEAALHRKYFEATGKDLLEKAPGMGLGNLIGKMAEANISIDPGLGNQIHLINQVRIHSVHQKQEPFYPTKEQARAIMLYTFDVIRKLFS
ncbi:MAG: DUF4145 domain-containing protein [Candidatus Woesearchaeota archaeon]|jgi:hypothetical protein|nr:DUF4145 domain-containing protein [Candidatus Woesearchaeota archaeon]MDP7181611.1 DUF4145 domain-containing protein [Candidatus Woesearchaeota archaeon]MDP7198921.1 DUF4145 domain-containing protein [Candidatus Woesearchaeota archaeon]MDP7467300.1 DUF4145 domain-containing protein [Candidatus Woesearchaeota archaeon]MDP7647916.1 DUF4145 domain-containing protein [Candidatus Woesearchaeota archaeon]